MAEFRRQEERIFELLQELNKALAPKFERCAGISPTRLRMLHELLHEDEISQNALQRIIGIDAAAVTRHLRALEDKGMIVRRSDPADGRAALVSLSGKGREEIGFYCKEKARFIGSLLGGFGEEEMESVAGLLARLLGNIRKM